MTQFSHIFFGFATTYTLINAGNLIINQLLLSFFWGIQIQNHPIGLVASTLYITSLTILGGYISEKGHTHTEIRNALILGIALVFLHIFRMSTLSSFPDWWHYLNITTCVPACIYGGLLYVKKHRKN